MRDREKGQRRRTMTSSDLVIVIVNSKLLKRHSKAKRRAPAYSRALRQIRGVFQRIVRGRLVAEGHNGRAISTWNGQIVERMMRAMV